MSEEPRPGPLDGLIEAVASLMDAVGLNGRRLRWRWNQRKRSMAEAGAQGEQMLRSARAKHKMCPACRALVSRSASECPECGVSLEKVKQPGTGRLVSNLFPGITATTSLIMLVNGFWFVVMLMAQTKSGGSGGLGLFSAFDLEMSVQFGAGLSRERVLSSGVVTGGEWWRLITPIFLHGGIMHFFFNSYLLIYLGPMVESIYGAQRFWVIYLLCGLSGSMASQLPRFTITVGASGAILGLIGLLLVYGIRNRSALGEGMKQLVVRLLMYTVIMSFVFNIDHLNHAGGFACGALLAMVVPTDEPRSRAESTFWQALALIGVAVVVIAFYNVAQIARAGLATG